MIYYFENNEIDRQKWDACITNASNGLIYAYSFYLDFMTSNWNALVLNDYEAIMPLPYRNKFGIYYIYQPFLTAQLGLFGNKINAELLQKFLESIPSQYKYLDFSLNHNNLFAVNGFPLHERLNYILNMNKPYELIYKNYRENVKRNIKKSKEYGCYLQKDIDVHRIIKLTKTYGQNIEDKDEENFISLYNYLKEKKLAITYGIFSPQHQLLASSVFLFSHHRSYYILVGNHPNGRTMGSSHALIDEFIKEHSNQNISLDFEGSDNRNLAFFYSSFGACEEKYSAIKYNRLPYILKWLKK
jgi:hypothetical protein